MKMGLIGGDEREREREREREMEMSQGFQGFGCHVSDLIWFFRKNKNLTRQYSWPLMWHEK